MRERERAERRSGDQTAGGAASGDWRREDASDGGSRTSWRGREGGGAQGGRRGMEKEGTARILVRNQRTSVSPSSSGKTGILHGLLKCALYSLLSHTHTLFLSLN